MDNSLRDQFKHLLDGDAPAADTSQPTSSPIRTDSAQVVHPDVTGAPGAPVNIRRYMPYVFILIVAIIGYVAYSSRQEFFDFCKQKQDTRTAPPASTQADMGDFEESDDEQERIVDTTEQRQATPDVENQDPMFDPL